MLSGIYQIRNLIDGKIYVGSAINFKRRWYRHKNYLKMKKHENLHLQRAYNRDGGNNFVFEVLEECGEEKLLIREQYYLDLYKSYQEKNGYNIRSVAKNNLGLKYSKETKKKMSDSQRGKRHSVESRKKMSEIGKLRTGEIIPTSKLKWDDVFRIREKYRTGNYSLNELAKENSVTKTTINRIVKCKSWIRKNNEKIEIFVYKRPISGEFSLNAKLAHTDVFEIREKYRTGNYFYRNLAKEYGVSHSTIQKIINNVTWKEENR